MDEAEAFIRRRLQELFGLEARKLPERVAPTADFELIREGKVVAVAELKTFDPRDAAEVELDCHDDDLIAGVLGNDNGTERVGNAINKGARQLRGYECPKVLVLLNFDECMDESDLVAAYRGELNYIGSDGRTTIDRSAARVAEGRIREKKKLLDVFLWVDGRSGKATARFRGDDGRAVAEQLFGYRGRSDTDPSAT